MPCQHVRHPPAQAGSASPSTQGCLGRHRTVLDMPSPQEAIPKAGNKDMLPDMLPMTKEEEEELPHLEAIPPTTEEEEEELPQLEAILPTTEEEEEELPHLEADDELLFALACSAAEEDSISEADCNAVERGLEASVFEAARSASIADSQVAVTAEPQDSASGWCQVVPRHSRSGRRCSAPKTFQAGAAPAPAVLAADARSRAADRAKAGRASMAASKASSRATTVPVKATKKTVSRGSKQAAAAAAATAAEAAAAAGAEGAEAADAIAAVEACKIAEEEDEAQLAVEAVAAVKCAEACDAAETAAAAARAAGTAAARAEEVTEAAATTVATEAGSAAAEQAEQGAVATATAAQATDVEMEVEAMEVVPAEAAMAAEAAAAAEAAREAEGQVAEGAEEVREQSLEERFKNDTLHRIMWDCTEGGNNVEPCRLITKAPDARLKRGQCIVLADSSATAADALVYAIEEKDDMLREIQAGTLIEVPFEEDNQPDVQAFKYIATRRGSTQLYEGIAFGPPQPMRATTGQPFTKGVEMVSHTAVVAFYVGSQTCQPFPCGAQVEHLGFGHCTLAAPLCCTEKLNSHWMLLLYNGEWNTPFSLAPLEHVRSLLKTADSATLNNMQQAVTLLTSLPAPKTACKTSFRAVKSKKDSDEKIAQEKEKDAKAARHAAKERAREAEAVVAKEDQRRADVERQVVAAKEAKAASAATERTAAVATEKACAAKAAKAEAAKAEAAEEAEARAAEAKARAAKAKELAGLKEKTEKAEAAEERKRRGAARTESGHLAEEGQRVDVAAEAQGRRQPPRQRGAAGGGVRPSSAALEVPPPPPPPGMEGIQATLAKLVESLAEANARQSTADARLAQMERGLRSERAEAAANEAKLRAELAQQRDSVAQERVQHLAEVQAASASASKRHAAAVPRKPSAISASSSPDKKKKKQCTIKRGVKHDLLTPPGSRRHSSKRGAKRDLLTPPSSRSHSPTAKRQSPRLRRRTASSPASAATSPSTSPSSSSSFTSPSSSSLSASSSGTPSPIVTKKKKKEARKGRLSGNHLTRVGVRVGVRVYWRQSLSPSLHLSAAGRSRPPAMPKKHKHKSKIGKTTTPRHSPRLQRLLLEEATLNAQDQVESNARLIQLATLNAQDQVASNARLVKAHEVRARLAMFGHI